VEKGRGNCAAKQIQWHPLNWKVMQHADQEEETGPKKSEKPIP
jgi:hypothetical protein